MRYNDINFIKRNLLSNYGGYMGVQYDPIKKKFISDTPDINGNRPETEGVTVNALRNAFRGWTDFEGERTKDGFLPTLENRYNLLTQSFLYESGTDGSYVWKGVQTFGYSFRNWLSQWEKYLSVAVYKIKSTDPDKNVSIDLAFSEEGQIFSSVKLMKRINGGEEEQIKVTKGSTATIEVQSELFDENGEFYLCLSYYSGNVYKYNLGNDFEKYLDMVITNGFKSDFVL